MGGLPTNRTVNHFAVEPGNPKVMYAALRDGLFKSMDSGNSWKRIGNDVNNLAAVAVNPQSPSEIYVSLVDGTIFVSGDGGMKWKKQQ